METKKRLLIIALGICIFLILGGHRADASLGLSPALVETDYEPGKNFLINYNVLGADSSQKLELYAEGEFAENVRFDKTNLTGPESFTVYVNLPETAKNPGRNRLFIRVREVNEGTGGIGTRLEIGTLIIIKVPYPGKYAEIKSFGVNDANENEPVNFNLDVESLGYEDVYINPNIKVYSNGEVIEDINFDGETIKSGTSETFSKTSDYDYKAGIYNATATVDFGKIIKKEVMFRIGSLFVNITNWSSSFQRGKINEFHIEIESRWNSDIKNVYAEVNVTKDSEKVDFFKTPSIELKKWEKDTLKGFFSSENLKAGDYNADISLFYEDKKTEKIVNIKVFNPPVNMKFIIIVALVCAVILLLVGIIIYLLLRKNKSKKRNRK